MPFRKKNKQVDAPTPEEVAKLGHKHEVEAAKDKNSSVFLLTLFCSVSFKPKMAKLFNMNNLWMLLL